MKEFVSVSTMSSLFSHKAMMKNDFEAILNKEAAAIDSIARKLSNHYENSEIVYIMPAESIKNDIVKRLERHPQHEAYNVSIKFVHSLKSSKKYTLMNLGWQAATGDKIIFYENINELDKQLENMIECSSRELPVFIKNKNNSKKVFKEIMGGKNYRKELYHSFSASYNKVLNIQEGKKINDSDDGLSYQVTYPLQSNYISQNTRGYIIDRKTANDAFQSQKEQYEPYLAIARLPKRICIMSIDNNSDNVSPVEYYNKSYFEELMLMYTNARSKGHLLSTYMLPILLAAFAMIVLVIQKTFAHASTSIISSEKIPLSDSKLDQLINFDFISGLIAILFFVLAVMTLCKTIADVVKEHQILQRQILAASLEKSVVGQFEIQTYVF